MLGAVRALILGLLPARAAFGGARRPARVAQGSPEWPASDQWAALAAEVGGRLEPVTLPAVPPGDDTLYANPYFIRDQAGLTQSSGWIDAWRSTPSAYAVRASSAADVAAGVRFAARHRVRLVVKGGGHSYLGNSNAADSLLVWTRDLDTVELHDAFVPAGAPAGAAPVPAVSLGAGCVWLDAYTAVTTHGGRYVQGGGCTTVGVAGLVQGGGFGSFSKRYGLAAASLLEATVVTADGAIVTANAHQHPDLLWALKGGGGGTFGVVTRLTLRTHDLPPTFGLARWQVQASTDAAFRRLLAAFVEHYATQLCNEHWGEQASAHPRNRLEILMLFQGLAEETARGAWQPLVDFVAAHPGDYRTDAPLLVAALPADRLWDGDFLKAHMPSALTFDARPGAAPGHWWWRGNTSEAGTFWHGYQSAWLPARLLAPASRPALADAWYQASRAWSVTFHFNKGLAGAHEAARAASRDTAMNPEVLDAFALAIVADDGRSAYLGLTAADLAQAREDARNIDLAMTRLKRVAPGAGCYIAESDYHLADWPRAYWGEHRARLRRIKRRYDPENLFQVHHGVDSDPV